MYLRASFSDLTRQAPLHFGILKQGFMQDRSPFFFRRFKSAQFSAWMQIWENWKFPKMLFSPQACFDCLKRQIKGVNNFGKKFWEF